MLENTFIHLPNVGKTREKALWQNGIKTWDDFLEGFEEMPQHKELCNHIESSKYALSFGDTKYFSSTLHRSETWRCFKKFNKVAYVDIETTGLGKGRDYITVIGLFDGKKVHSYVHGINLDEFQDGLKGFDMAATFNGSLFDLPFIKSEFPETKIPHLHVDLRFALSSLGIRGGLKKIERQFGFEREDDLKGLTGYDAVLLWKEYKNKNNKDALDKLVRYNAADISNLEKLMEFAYKEKRKLTGFDAF